MPGFWDSFNQAVGPAMQRSGSDFSRQQEQLRREKEKKAEEERKKKSQWTLAKLKAGDIPDYYKKMLDEGASVDSIVSDWKNEKQAMAAKKQETEDQQLAADQFQSDQHFDAAKRTLDKRTADQEKLNNLERGKSMGLTGQSLDAFVKDPKQAEWRLKLMGGFPDSQTERKQKDVSSYARQLGKAKFEMELNTPEMQDKINRTAMQELGLTPADIAPGTDNEKLFDHRRRTVVDRMKAENEVNLLSKFPPGTTFNSLDKTGGNLDEVEGSLDKLITDLQGRLKTIDDRMKAAGM